MNSLFIFFTVFVTAVTCLAQGQVVFANKVGTAVDAPVFFLGSQDGPGPNYTAELWLLQPNLSLTPLTPASTFLPRGTVGAQLIADRYWERKLVDVPVQPGTDATFVVRVWLTSLGSYEAAQRFGGSYGQSAPFVVNVGGGTIPPPNLTTLKSFVFGFPEPSTVAIGVFGAAALLLFRRR